MLLNFLGSKFPYGHPDGCTTGLLAVWGSQDKERPNSHVLRLGIPMAWKWVYIWMNSNTFLCPFPLSGKIKLERSIWRLHSVI